MSMRQKKTDRLRSTSHARAKRQEPETAERLGGRVVKGSGSGDEKGDVRVHNVMRLECKTTMRKSFSVTREMIAKIESAAVAAGELPALEIEFNDENGKKMMACAVVPVWVLEAIATNGTWHD